MGPVNGLCPESEQSAASETPLQVVSRTVLVPSALGSGSDDVLGQDCLILAWALLLQRERGEDNPVDQFTWGQRSVDGTETAARLSLSSIGVELSRVKGDSISTFLDAIQNTSTCIPTPEAESLFFNDDSATPASPQKGESGLEQPVGSWERPHRPDMN